MSAVTPQLRNALAAIIAMAGIGVGGVVGVPAAIDAYTQHQYLQAIAGDTGTSDAVKIGMVLAAYYESSFDVRLRPYRDDLSAARPWTVCNGITDAGMPAGFGRIDPQRSYTLDECYVMERALFTGYEARMPGYVPAYHRANVWQQATFLDFVHHFGWGNFSTSTMRRKANAGDLSGACAEHARWKYTTLPSGVKTIVAGLEARADGNAELCALPPLPRPQVQVFVDHFEALA